MTSYFRKANQLMMTIAKNPETPPEVLHQLVLEAEDPDLFEQIAENKNALPETLMRLSKHECGHVRVGVAHNAHTPMEVLWQLSFDLDPDVRYSLAANPLIPVVVLQSLITDENPYVASRARLTLARLSPSPYADFDQVSADETVAS
jgi:hypothetical protein